MKFYPVVDYIPWVDMVKIGFNDVSSVEERMSAKHRVRGILEGTFRAPRKGEYYLSGAIPEVYRATNALSQRYYIIKLVRVKIDTEPRITILSKGEV